MSPDALGVCIGLMEDVLVEKTVDLPGKTGCSVSGRESDGKFSAELHSNPTNDSKNSAMWHTNRKVLIIPLVILLMI